MQLPLTQGHSVVSREARAGPEVLTAVLLILPLKVTDSNAALRLLNIIYFLLAVHKVCE